MAAYDPSTLSALVVDDNHYQRGITTDIVRTIGVGRVLQADNAAEGWDLIVTRRPDCIFIDWLSGSFNGLELIHRIRKSPDSPNRTAAIFMVTAQGSRTDVERARFAGANAFLRKPISVMTLKEHLRTIVSNPVPFVESASYVGPCRRRKQDTSFTGLRRRLSDQIEAARDDEDVRREIAKARIAHLEKQAMRLSPNDPDSARRVFMAAHELRGVAAEVEDGPLTLGASELVRYLETQGASSGLDFEALRTHIAALHQLVHLPNAMGMERQRVAESLTKMVDKKLRQATAA
jgi:two-component system chemotaxis response regulator CheY